MIDGLQDLDQEISGGLAGVDIQVGEALLEFGGQRHKMDVGEWEQYQPASD